jgi:CheY-like chemotaxis protein
MLAALQADLSSAGPQPEEGLSASAKTPRKILVVDDIPEICQLHERLVRLLGHEAQCLTDPRLAVDEAKRLQPDMVLLDIAMPGMDGWEVARQLRADPATHGIRLVAVTALSTPDDVRRSLDAGFDAHYRKPVSIEQWREILAP